MFTAVTTSYYINWALIEDIVVVVSSTEDILASMCQTEAAATPGENYISWLFRSASEGST